jgi:predicted transcriptional regulator of viral defense system
MADRLQQIFSGQGALRTNELERRGFSRLQISQAAKHGTIERIGRGLYTLPGAELSEHQSLIEVVKGSPTVRICLLSALRFHNLTTQNPHEVWIAIGPKDRRPAIKSPKLRVYRFSGPALKEGLEEHTIQGATIRVYSVAKTVVDLFRYRNKVGIDVALEALKEGWREKRFAMSEIDRLARLCRMSRVMAPYPRNIANRSSHNHRRHRPNPREQRRNRQ